MIRGRTLASFLLQLRKRRKLSSSIYLDVLVIDEVSMMRKSQLAQLDKLFRSAKRVSGVPFGGVHIILVGDFLQLPPIGGEPLYQRCNGCRQRNANEVAGFELWREFDCVIVFKESVRFSADPEWGRGRKFARKGVWLPEFVQLINSRVTCMLNTREAWGASQSKPSFITPDNSTRLSINNLFISTAASLMGDGEYPVRVVADFKGKLSKLGSSEVQMVMAYPDTKFGRMAPYLDLIVGMPIQITQNIRAAKMVANGTLGTLEAIIYQPDITFTASSMQGCAGSDLFPIFSDARPYEECEIKLAPTKASIPRCLAVRIQQFPMVCAVSATIYKVQGDTLNDMVVTEWRSKNRIANKREQPYLLVSRVTSRNAFRTLCSLTGEIIAWARPSQGALNEEERLQRLTLLLPFLYLEFV